MKDPMKAFLVVDSQQKIMKNFVRNIKNLIFRPFWAFLSKRISQNIDSSAITLKIPLAPWKGMGCFIFKSALLGLRQILAAENLLIVMKNTFYFTLKTLFVPKIFKFLSWIFGHVEKWID